MMSNIPDHEIADSAQWWKEKHDELEAENERLQSTIEFAHTVASHLEAELDDERDLRYKIQNETSKRIYELEADATKLENEVIRLEDKNDALSKKNEALMKLAGMYIKSYEDLAFGDATKDVWVYCGVCDAAIKPEEMDERHIVGIGDYHAGCCPQCTMATADELTDE